eukprot:9103549-Lingulodinium_polyedra.AAC.1
MVRRQPRPMGRFQPGTWRRPERHGACTAAGGRLQTNGESAADRRPGAYRGRDDPGGHDVARSQAAHWGSSHGSLAARRSWPGSSSTSTAGGGPGCAC